MQSRGAYYVLTGERDSGKTLLCTDLAAEARARNLDVGGILTAQSGPGLHSPRQVIDLRSGASRQFGVPAQPGADPLTPGWELKYDVFDWATEVLAAATPCDLLIVDEVGPLELRGGRGWVHALEVLRKGDFGAGLVVCRRTLLKELEASLGGPPAGLFEAGPHQSDDLADIMLMEMLGR
jgi:nucleoside-triphosphatase THEP1